MKNKMKVLVIGSGGREHALVWKLSQSPCVDKIICAPGNGGTAGGSKCQNVNIKATDIPALVELADREQFDLTVPGPEAPLVAGIVDQWPDGLRIWGPNAYAASLEGSKIFAKKALNRFGIPTAQWIEFDNHDKAKSWLAVQDEDGQVVKADGLTGGKGAIVCDDRIQTSQAIDQMSSFGDAGKRFIIEKRLYGREASLFLLCSGNGQIIPLQTAQDYKRAGDGDTGLNTGGMGGYSPASHLTPKMITAIISKLRPMIAEVGFIGFLYVGLMLTDVGWFILEFNVRMGDPETQVVLPRLQTDLAQLLYALSGRKRWSEGLSWTSQAAVTVVMTSGGYPGDYKTGYVITGLDRVQEMAPGAIVFHAGTKWVDGQILTNGGRVLNVTAIGDDIAEARKIAYAAAVPISWEDVNYRNDIAKSI